MSSEPILTLKNGLKAHSGGPKSHHFHSGEYHELIYSVGGITFLSIACTCVRARLPFGHMQGLWFVDA